jgi:FAD:protein FMN transferase
MGSKLQRAQLALLLSLVLAPSLGGDSEIPPQGLHGSTLGRDFRIPPASARRYEYSQIAMGVAARIVVYAPNEEAAKRACAAAFDRIARLEDIMSDYRPTSELMRLCAKSRGRPVVVSPELMFVLKKSRELSIRSDGAFDVTVGPLVRLWREARKSGELPAPDKLAAARKFVGWGKMTIDAKKRAVRLAVSGMKLDLGGIAKGYACDEAIRVLKKRGIGSAMVEMGGDIVVSGPPPGEKGWVIEILNADPASSRQTLSNSAVSSSGDIEQYAEIDGKRYSHIVDPRTGLGLTDRIAVTVIAPNGITSDGLSTAISVLGPDKGQVLARTYLATAYIRHAEF